MRRFWTVNTSPSAAADAAATTVTGAVLSTCRKRGVKPSAGSAGYRGKHREIEWTTKRVDNLLKMGKKKQQK